MNLKEVQQLAITLGKGLPPVDALVCIPRGGVMAGAFIAPYVPRQQGTYLPPKLVLPEEVSSPAWPSPRGFALVDDVIATGETIARVCVQLPNLNAARVVVVLVKKSPGGVTGTYPLHYGVESSEWVVFPWEAHDEAAGPEDAVRRLIEFAGDNPVREGLLETPRRVLKYLDELREQRQAPFEATVFDTESDDLVTLSGIPFYSLCEHHMLPYFGVAHIAYLPAGKHIGASKPARMLARHAAGLTMQETLTHAVAYSLQESVGTEDVAVRTIATHTCLVMRGPKAQGSRMTCSAMYGAFRKSAQLRAEFDAIIQQAKAL